MYVLLISSLCFCFSILISPQLLVSHLFCFSCYLVYTVLSLTCLNQGGCSHLKLVKNLDFSIYFFVCPFLLFNFNYILNGFLLGTDKCLWIECRLPIIGGPPSSSSSSESLRMLICPPSAGPLKSLLSSSSCNDNNCKKNVQKFWNSNGMSCNGDDINYITKFIKKIITTTDTDKGPVGTSRFHSTHTQKTKLRDKCNNLLLSNKSAAVML